MFFNTEQAAGSPQGSCSVIVRPVLHAGTVATSWKNHTVWSNSSCNWNSYETCRKWKLQLWLFIISMHVCTFDILLCAHLYHVLTKIINNNSLEPCQWLSGLCFELNSNVSMAAYPQCITFCRLQNGRPIDTMAKYKHIICWRQCTKKKGARNIFKVLQILLYTHSHSCSRQNTHQLI